MPGTFTYTEATNLVVITAGTSGSPADFPSFVTADRAGTGTELLAAAAGSATNTLTYAVRPVEDLAILVKCIIAAKSTETDYIFITGTDWRGAAQTESLDVSAGDGSYTSTKYWATISNLDCSDNPAGGGTVWADGTIQVTQDIWGVIWDHTVSQSMRMYRIDSHVDFGDGSTSTYFLSEARNDGDITDQFVYFNDSLNFTVAASATLRLGRVDSAAGTQGVCWSWKPADGDFVTGGTMLIYASRLLNRASEQASITSGTLTVTNSILMASFRIDGTSGTSSAFQRSWNMIGGTITLDDVYIVNNGQLDWGVTPSSAVDLVIHRTKEALAAVAFTAVTVNLTRGKIINAEGEQYVVRQDATLNHTDANFAISDTEVEIREDGTLNVIWTCNIHVADAAGADLSGVTVLCEDQASVQVFSVSTDANGDIAEQSITGKAYTYSGTPTSPTITNNSPHVFTISKTGYKTLVLEQITVDSPIVWHLELETGSGGLLVHPGTSGGARA